MSSIETPTAESPADVDTTNVDVVSDAPVSTESNEEAPVIETTEGGEEAPVIAAEGAEKAEAFTPSYKYRAALEDREVDDFWRPLMKDKESEEKVIKALQRLDGFDKVHESREKVLSDYSTLEQDYQAVQQDVTRFNDALSKGDLTSAFRQAGLNDQQIFQWAQERLQYMDLPPEQRRAIEETEMVRQQQAEIENEKSQYQTMYEEQAVQTRTLHLDFVLSRPEVADPAGRWDSKMGAGSFRDLVVSEAQNHFARTKEDLSAEQATQMVIQKFGNMIGPGETSTGQPQAGQVQTQANPQSKPVIPNISGKNASPIKRVAKSIEDIKAMAKEFDSAENNSNY